MYWWNYRKLAEALQNGTVKPWQLKVYWTVFLLTIAAAIALTLPTSKDTTATTVYNLLIPISLFVIVATTYRINKSGDGKDYLKRFVCLDFPITIRSLTLFTLPALIIYLIQFGKRMFEACPNMQTEAEFNACFMPQLELLAQPTFVDAGVYFLTLLVSLYWYRNAFLYVTGKKQ